MFEDRLQALRGRRGRVARRRPAWRRSPRRCLSYLKTGDHVVAGRAMFGSCRYVVETLCRALRHHVHARRRQGSRCLAHGDPPEHQDVLLRDPVEPEPRLVDIAAVSKIARDNGILTIVDNVFATPMLQRPLALGADIVVYSATKHIDGQGRCLGGAVLGSSEFITKYVQDWVRPDRTVHQSLQCLGDAERP